MIRLFTQLVLAAAMVEFVPTSPSALEYATLPEAKEAPALVEGISAWIPAPLPTSGLRPPEKVDATRLGVITTASSVLVADAGSGAELFAKHPEEVRSIGSLTKLLAALVFLETNPDVSAPASVLPVDLRQGGRDHLYVEDEVSVRHLLEASLVGSDNPATIALARLSGLSPEQFAARMNEKAGEIGMRRAAFVEPTGLDPHNVATARDIVVLLKAALDNPTITEISRIPLAEFSSTSGRTYSIPTTNNLLASYLNAPPYAIAVGKTGYLPLAGYGVGVRVEDGVGHALYTVVLGSETAQSRFQEAKALSQWAFDVYRWPDETL
ncbi:D-alanyl-D-alanine carboxypeptidase [Candidatus Uhrbacteria bacterium]|nr:D-alanyl-D-alanine carboxypeptidase [Candidatus Uhrbacteria bacterium]